MPFPAQVFRILIASPSDVAEEREMAVRAIQGWNDLNAADRQLVLLPLRWESHSAPEYGTRPQEVINRQVVDHCDLLVGIFWTRVGSPTGVAESGTVEEIERVANAGHPVMLYFSQTKQDPEKIDIEQLAKLREFKKKTFKNALVESYADPVEFRDKFARQIEIQLRSLLASSDEAQGGVSQRPVTDIVLRFADAQSGESRGADVACSTRFITVQDFDGIPDYVAPQKASPEVGLGKAAPASNLWMTALKSSENKEFYRQYVSYHVMQQFFTPVRFWLQNLGSIGARDVYIEVDIEATGDLVVMPKDQIPSSPPSKAGGSFGLLGTDRHVSRPEEFLSGKGNAWSTKFEVRALQPQRQISPEVRIFIGATASCEVKFRARIFADTLPEPSRQELTMHLSVADESLTVADIFPGEDAEA